MRRPLFQGLYFGLIAESWLLDMHCPPSIPPAPCTDTVSISEYYQSCERPVSSVSLPFVTYAAIDRSEPRLPDAAKYIDERSWENILTNPPVGQINLEQWVLIKQEERCYQHS